MDMLHLLPPPSNIKIKDGFLNNRKFKLINHCSDIRIDKILSCFDTDENGTILTIKYNDLNSEAYTLNILENSVTIIGESAAGAFYGIQTLKQILNLKSIPCLYIEDKPSMEYRGVYHDVTRGKVPTVKTLKKLIDKLAFYKINSLQIYIEHTFPFKELGDNVEKTGCLTHSEIKELDDYCYDNFIDFIPSIATFGHLYELLQKDEYKHLQAIEGFEEDRIFWWMRQKHHTIDPTNMESFELIKSLIDQYIPLFRSNKFNICCDETFDLTEGKYKGKDTGKLYVEFVKRIISYLESKGKKVMMWGDILLEHPGCIGDLPEDIEFLNWCYCENPDVENIKTLAKSVKRQIVCPGTSTWARLVECVEVADSNITKMLDYGHKYNAVGMLNTNWGDFGNPCSIELSMHGLILGASKSWNIDTTPNAEFNDSINFIEYRNDDGVKYLTMLDEAHKNIRWIILVYCYSNLINKFKFDISYPEEKHLKESILICRSVLDALSSTVWEREEYRNELLLAAEGIIVIAELFAKLAGYKINRVTDTMNWLKKYRNSWLMSNKESELFEIEKMFITLENTD